MDIEIKKPSLYRLIYRYVNVNNNVLRGQVMLKPQNPTDVTQNSEVFFQVTTEPMFVTVGSGRDYEFVLNPGRWKVSISSPDILLLVCELSALGLCFFFGRKFCFVKFVFLSIGLHGVSTRCLL